MWRRWIGVRADLKVHAAAWDILFITYPAAIWMLPWSTGLPIRRQRFIRSARRELYVYPIGGVRWLIRCADESQSIGRPGTKVTRSRWSSASMARF